MMTPEQTFFDSARRFTALRKTVKTQETTLLTQLKALEQRLTELSQGNGDTRKDPIADHAEQLYRAIAAEMKEWQEDWEAKSPARSLSATFDDRLIFLVFGKVNAGKSSFLNFFCRRAEACGFVVTRSRIENNKRVPLAGEFEEGSIETTAAIQIADLGGLITLLDTPGLHSVTAENGDLTKRYTDAADGLMWLTGSNSPGQVEELKALSEELQMSKPVQPVITKSDTRAWKKVDGQMVSSIANKSDDNRREQEEYVNDATLKALAGEKISVEKPPAAISLSAMMAQEEGCTPSAMTAAGFDRLYQQLLPLSDRAIAYKKEKALTQMKGHTAKVTQVIDKKLLPFFSRQIALCEDTMQDLLGRTPQLSLKAAQRLEGEIDRIIGAINADAETDSRKAGERFQTELNAALPKITLEILKEGLADYFQRASEATMLSVTLTSTEACTPTVNYVAYEEKTGSFWSGLFSLVGVVAGMLVNPLAALAGSAVGSTIGGTLAGTEQKRRFSSFDWKKTKKDILEKLQPPLQSAIRENIQFICNSLAKQADTYKEQMSEVAFLADTLKHSGK
ncbi:GTPase [Novispirillum itersonii]|uniref:tRNA U34 5-carboxymethylaminomethyl modifying GTPase MnmE/TrmE n=1 Tax=Novispirillum itersonii TaxID=189 RepID=A0A7W9ZH78_NOVIT|nr:GTPase [Novispirillum itersonii]MBB6210224.1 tRNA U34 5-carboxymethylaminomethyl modifying GTPase MnmE/TrmE [Novispirillum itersonii]